MVGTVVDVVAGKLQYRITAEDDTKAGVNSAIANITRLDTATSRALTQFRRQYKEGLLTLDQYGNLVAATYNNLAATVPSTMGRVNTSIEQTGRSLFSLSGMLSNIMYGLAAGVAIGAVYGFIGAIRSAIDAVAGFIAQSAQLSGTMEMIKISFETLSGSAQQAGEMYSWLWELSLRSPFKFQDVADATRQLQGYGLTWEQIQRTVKATGDVAAALGRSSEDYGRFLMALGQIKAFGTLRGQEAMQLVNAGIPVWDILAEHYKKSVDEVRELAEKKELGTGDEILDVLLTAFESPKYKGAMERMNKTLVGQTTQLEETIQYIMIQLGDVFNTVLLPILTWVNDKLLEWLPTLRQWGSLVTGVLDSLKNFWNSLTGLKGDESLSKFLKGLLEIAGPIVIALAALNPVFTGIVAGVIGVGMALKMIFSEDYWNAMYNFGQAFLLVLNAISGGLNVTTDAVKTMSDFIAGYLKFMVDVSEVVLTLVTVLTDNSRSLGERLGDIFRWILTVLIDTLQGGLTLLATILLKGMILKIEILENSINKIIDVINAGGQRIIEGVKTLFEFLSSKDVVIYRVGATLGGKFVNGLLEFVESGINRLSSRINSWVSGLPGFIRGMIGANPIGGINLGRIQLPSGDLASNFDISNWSIPHVDFGGIESGLYDIGQGLISGLMDEIDRLQEKYGLNITLKDLEKKYNVNTTGFTDLLEKLRRLLKQSGGEDNNNPIFSDDTPLKDLKTAVDKLSDSINGKQWKFNLYFDVKVENAGNEEEVRQVGDTLQDSVRRAIQTAMAKGVTPS